MTSARTHDSRCIDYKAATNGRVMLSNAMALFIRGIRGPRENPVSRKAIFAWFEGTDRTFVDDVLTTLVVEGRVRAVRNSLRNGNNAAQATYYEAV